jgi:precorrin-6Y C5,15-methyltransferase (decarboxylating)
MKETLVQQPIRIDVIGLGVTQPPCFSEDSICCFTQADVILGSQRQLDSLFELRQLTQLEVRAQTKVLPKFSELKTLLTSDEMHQKQLVVLASGDPLFYGIGRWLKQQFNDAFDEGRLVFHPAVSSIQAACHRMGLSLQEIDVLSLHGRPLEKLRSQLKANRTLAILTDQFSHPRALAQECVAAGYGESRLTVYERLGYAEERCYQFSVNEWLESADVSSIKVDPLHVSILEVKGLGGQLPVFPGFPDDLFETGAEAGKGMISKREVRLSILSYLEPNYDDIIWDIGAGCGGVAVELAYWNNRVQVYAIEHHAERLEYLDTNRSRFGVVANLGIVAGRAPDCLVDLPSPTKVFIGGSDGALAELLAKSWDALPVGGILVASAVMQSTKDQLKSFAEDLGSSHSSNTAQTVFIESTEIAVKRGRMGDGELEYQAKYPVEIFQFKKGVRGGHV